MQVRPGPSQTANETKAMNPISRRGLLRGAGMMTAAFAARRAWGGILGANERINGAVIGVGNRCSDHLALLQQHIANKQDIEVVALCDGDKKRIGLAAAKFPD